MVLGINRKQLNKSLYKNYEIQMNQIIICKYINTLIYSVAVIIKFKLDLIGLM